MANAGLDTTQAHSRKALIIGNISYTKNPLRHCVNDAKDLAEVLCTLGFQVELGINRSREDMVSLISTFARSIGDQDLVLFYFSGHGLQSKEINYLIPVDADERILEEEDIGDTSINVQNTLDRLSSKTSYITIFILDCCRSYKLPSDGKDPGGDNRTAGLHPMTPPGGTLLQFASAPGTIAKDGSDEERNGLYTKHLLKHIKTPNKDLDSILKIVSGGVYMESKQRQMPNSVSTIMIEEPIIFNPQQPSQTPNPDNTEQIQMMEQPSGPLSGMSISHLSPIRD